MSANGEPVFFDSRRQRWRKTVRVGYVAGLAFAIISTCFIFSLFITPLLPSVSVFRHNRTSAETRHGPFSARAAQVARLKGELSRERERERHQAALLRRAPVPPSKQIVAAFYVNWEDTGIQSLRANIDKLTHFMPEWLFLGKDGFTVDADAGDPRKQPMLRDVLRIVIHRKPIIPMLKNYDGDWEPVRLRRLLRATSRHHEFAVSLRDLLIARNYQGVNVDLEMVGATDRDNMTHLMREVYAVLHQAGLLVCQDVPALQIGNEADYPFDLAELAKCNDFIVFMAYDEHEESSAAGPIASTRWFERQWRQALECVPSDKLVLAIGNYAYDWTTDRRPARDLTYQAALTQAAEHHEGEAPQQVIAMDPRALNPRYDYDDDDGKAHQVWMLNAVTAFNEWNSVRRDNPRGLALWYLGSEDPSIWTFLDRAKLGEPPDWRPLETVVFPYEIDYEGEGEILQVLSRSRNGQRELAYDGGLITRESYTSFPSSYVIQRSGKQERMVALTFDDGPDERFTPQILDVLKLYNVAATFFVVGQNAEEYPGLVRRAWDEGHELGNHSFTHPNMALISETRARLEINTTQRVIESITGHSTLEFRPPYTADAEPRTADEVKPLLLISQGKLSAGTNLTYYTIGESIDPRDWDAYVRDNEGNPVRNDDGSYRTRTARDIANLAVEDAARRLGNIILLHDAGGDRTATVEAVPEIIKRLRDKGFRFVTVSELVGKPPRALNPEVRPSERPYVTFEGFVFRVYFSAMRALYWIFLVAIFLGISRMAMMLILALLEYVRDKRVHLDLQGDRANLSVSVIIAAYNEARVIARTIDAVLASRNVDLEVIVVDDGSTDTTADEVRIRYGNDPRVQLVRQPNGGKASALNRGIQQARGDLLVSLDADTVFTPLTIGRLVRHFNDRRVGAVAGNVKVGNRVNLLTYWQSIEYTTCQNLDRRAYSLLNAITVVPGAVGAWRREAVETAGGYTSDTLAEDTDLTWRIRRNGYRVVNEPCAVAYTEAPDTLSALFRQRFRWTFGTLQCLWKHRDALGRYGFFGGLALPCLWIYQILFQVVSPLIDLQVLATLGGVLWAFYVPHQVEVSWIWTAGRDLAQIGFYYSLFFLVELVGALFAFIVDGENPAYLWWLFLQRFVYRQLMYAVVFRTVLNAVRGSGVGWGKLQRKNSVRPPLASETALEDEVLGGGFGAPLPDSERQNQIDERPI